MENDYCKSFILRILLVNYLKIVQFRIDFEVLKSAERWRYYRYKNVYINSFRKEQGDYTRRQALR